MARVTAKVTIQMGLMEISDVGVIPVVDSGEKISLNMLHADCRHRVQQKYHCPTCVKDILDKKTEIIKGYEQGKNDYVILSEGEIEACKKASSDRLRILQFVDENEIGEIWHRGANYLKGEGDNFNLFYRLLVDCKKVALGKVVLREKDHFFAVKPYEDERGNKALIAYDLHFPNELRTAEDAAIDENIGLDPELIDLARQLVVSMTKPFDGSIIQDDYTISLKNIITAKAEGKVVDIPKPAKANNVISLKDALRESLKVAVNC